jgi:hypothetical protein
MKNFYFLTLFVVCLSCAEKEANSEENQTDGAEIEQKDSLAVVKDTLALEVEEVSFPVHEELDGDFKLISLPYALDSSDLEALEMENSLSYEQVELLTTNLDSNFAWEMEYELNTFFKIDSLKRAGTYEDYVSSLDIGQMKNSEAYPVGYIELAPNKQLFLWGLQYGTYEACPFMAGTTIYGSIFENGVQTSTRVFAELMAGGDPPSMMSKLIELKISEEGEALIHAVEIHTELADEGEDIVEFTEDSTLINLRK